MEEQREIAIECIGVFEDLLDRNEIDLPDEDRVGAGGEARIYGTTYYSLEDEITEVIKANYPKIIDDKLIRGILKETFDVIRDKFNYGISYDDEGFIEDIVVKKLCTKEIKD